MARAALFFEGEKLAERGIRVPKRVDKIDAWSKAALKTFRRELGVLSGSRACPKILVKHQITEDAIRLGYSSGHGILIDRAGNPLA